MADLDRIYRDRFPDAAEARKDRIWPEIVAFLGRWIDPAWPVLDIACDRGYFIRNVRAAERWASDMRDLGGSFPAEVHFVQGNGLDLGALVPIGAFGTVFMSNYLEHLPNADAVIEQLQVVRRLLRPGGKVLILQPNVRLVGGAYWDFIDHRVALTEKSLVEAAQLADLKVVRLITRFLPYSTVGRLPVHPLFVRAYLKFPPAWLILGRQTLLIAEPR